MTHIKYLMGLSRPRRRNSMSLEQAMNIMEQAVQLAVKGCGSTGDMKAVLVAWDTVRPLIKKPEPTEQEETR